MPVRVNIGIDVGKRVCEAEAARAREAEKWPHLTVSTLFEDAEPIPELPNHLVVAKLSQPVNSRLQRERV